MHEGLAVLKFGLRSCLVLELLRANLELLAVRGDDCASPLAQNNTVTRNVRAHAPPRLVLAPGVGM